MYLRDVAGREKRAIFLGQHVESFLTMWNHKKQQNVLALQVPAQSITESLSIYVYGRERDTGSILLAS